MHVDQGMQPTAMSPEGLPNSTSAKQAENDVEVGANMTGNQELDDQQGFQGPPPQGHPWMYHGPPPGWMGCFGGRGGGRGHRRARAMMSMFGPGMMGMMAAHGVPQHVDASNTAPNETRERHGRGGCRRGRGGRFNRHRFWSDLVFGEDDDVRSVAGHMEDCHLEEEDGGVDESRSDGSSSSSSDSSSGSSSSSDSSSSSSSDSDCDDDERSSKKKKSKGKRKHRHGGKKGGRTPKEKQACEVLLGDDAENLAAASSASGNREEDTAQGEGNDVGAKFECRRERDGQCGEGRHTKHGHGNRKRHHHHRHHGRHGRFPPHFEDMMMFGPPPPHYGPPPPPGMFGGPPPPGFFDGTPPSCPPGLFPLGPPPHGAAADLQDESNLAGCTGSRRSRKQLKKTAKKWRKANAKAWKLRAKMARQCRRRFNQSFGPDDNIEGEFGMLPPWVFLAHQFRRHHHHHHGHHGRRSGWRRQFFCDAGSDGHCGKRGDGCSRDGRPQNGAVDGSNKVDAAQNVRPTDNDGIAGVVRDQTPMEDVEIAHEAAQERDGNVN